LELDEGRREIPRRKHRVRLVGCGAYGPLEWSKNWVV
jgi:hypothetical protein